LGAGIVGAAGSTGGAAASAPPPHWPDLSLGRLYRSLSTDGAPALRVGVIVQAEGTTRFGRALLDDLCACPYVVPALVLRVAQPGIDAAAAQHRAPAAFRLYQRLVARKTRLAPDPLAAAKHDDLLGKALSLDCEVRGTGHVAPSAAAMGPLQAAQLDVIVNLTSFKPADELVAAARHGVWYYKVAGEIVGATPVPGLREFMARTPVTTAELCALLPDVAGPVVLRELHTATLVYLLPDANGSAPLWCAQHLLIAALHTLRTRGWTALLRKSTSSTKGAPAREDARARAPGNLAILAWLGGLLLARVWRRIRRRPQQAPVWNLALRRSARPLYERASMQDLREFRWIANPPGHFLADPFLFQDGPNTWLFFEDYSFATERGTLSCARLGDDGRLHDLASCLERPYHLSYPQVFRTGDGIFMIPETADAGIVELYRAVEFPYRWEWSAKLLDLRAVDSTVVRAAGRWWMFTSPMVVAANAPMTLLFAADDLRGPWVLQEQCDISADARAARGGGAIVDTSDGLIRPSQDCTLEYGRRLLFNRIGSLSPQGYSEHAPLVLDPGWLPGMVGIHSYARVGDWEAIDGLFESGVSPA